MGGGAPDLLAESKGTQLEVGGSRASPPRHRGRLEALTRPLHARRAGGEVRPRPAGRRGPARLGRVGQGLAGRGPRAAGWGRARRPGLVGTSRPGALARPGTWQIGAAGSWPVLRDSVITPPLPVPLYGRRGETPGAAPPPILPADSGLLPWRPGPGESPSVRPMESSWTASLGDRLRAPRAEPLLGWGSTTGGLCGGACPTPLASSGVASPGSSYEAQNPAGPRAGRMVP